MADILAYAAETRMPLDFLSTHVYPSDIEFMEDARKQGYSIIFGYSDGSSEADVNSIRELRSRMVDGIIAFGRGLPESAALYKSL